MSLNVVTIAVLCIGLGIVMIVSLLFQNVFRFRHRLYCISFNINNVGYNYINVNKKHIIIWMVIQFIMLGLVMKFLMEQTKALTLSSAINMYRRRLLITNDAGIMPLYIRLPRSICIYSGYIFIYLLAHSIIYKYNKEMRIFYLINMILPCVNTVIVGGSRGGIVQYLIAFITMWFVLYTFKENKMISTKYIIYAVVIITVLVISFGTVHSFLGRGVVEDVGDYLYMYLSGCIYNLDYYLDHFPMQCDSNNYTLINLYNFLFRLTGNSDYNYKSYLSDIYLKANGQSTGNVYTMFASYYHDGKITGVIIYSALMAFIGQLMIYLSMKTYKNSEINICLVLYGYIYFDFTQSFFANRFYAQFFTDTFFKMILFLLILRYFFTKNAMRIRIRI